MNSVILNNNDLSKSCKVYIIAEMSANPLEDIKGQNEYSSCKRSEC